MIYYFKMLQKDFRSVCLSFAILVKSIKSIGEKRKQHYF
jgi:hypothetical protein